MAFQAEDWVWSPDESTDFSYTGNLANMASSIERKAGAYVFEATGTATPIDSTNFAPYTPGNVMVCERVGRMVFLDFAWKCTTANYLQGTTDRKFGRIPVGFRPKRHVRVVQQGSGTTKYYLQVSPNGEISASRADTSHSNNFWMPVSISYLGED